MGLLWASGPLFAHHGRAIYETDRIATMKGTVTEVQFVNPHVLIRLEVKFDNSNAEKWTAETAPPAMLYRIGWNRNTIKPGDHVTLSGYKARDGSRLISVRKIMLPNGLELNQRSN